MTCQDLDGLSTLFVDDECSSADRAAIIEHLKSCESCRARVLAESTAKHLLRSKASIARTMGVPPPWRPRVFRLGRPTLPVRPTVLIFVLLLAGGGIGLLFRPTPVIAVGVIGDSICAREHRFWFRTSDRDCVLGCVASGAEFVLITETQVYRIRNQQMPQLAELANTRVKVEGRFDGGTIVVAKLTPAADPSRVPDVP
jgi:hypothetical protein